MQSLIVYKSIKMPRSIVSNIVTVKGTMSKLCILYAIASYRPGTPGQWIGTVRSLRQALHLPNNTQVINLLEALASNGYLTYSIENKLVSYTLPWYSAEKRNRHYGTQYIPKQSVRQSKKLNIKNNAVATTDQGWFFLPKISLIASDGCYEEADAWMDLWTHTIYQDYFCAFSYLAPCVSFGKYHSAITLEQLSERWGWEKTKVWRFLQKQKSVFPHFRLPGSYGMLIFNAAYPDANTNLPSMDTILDMIATMRDFSGYKAKSQNDNNNLNRMIAAHSRNLLVEKGYLTSYKGKRFSIISTTEIESEPQLTQNPEPAHEQTVLPREQLFETDRGVSYCKNQDTFFDFPITFCILANDEIERQKTTESFWHCIFRAKSPLDNINIILKPYGLKTKDCGGSITYPSAKNREYVVLGGDKA